MTAWSWTLPVQPMSRIPVVDVPVNVMVEGHVGVASREVTTLLLKEAIFPFSVVTSPFVRHGGLASSFVKQPLAHVPPGHSESCRQAAPTFAPASHVPPNLALHFVSFAGSGATPALRALAYTPRTHL